MSRAQESPTGIMPLPGHPIEERHIEAALRHVAILMERYGEALTPLFEQFEADLIECRRKRGPMERARALLEARMINGTVRMLPEMDEAVGTPGAHA